MDTLSTAISNANSYVEKGNLDGQKRDYTISSIFFFSSRRRHTRSDRDWSSDVCLPISHLPATWRWHDEVYQFRDLRADAEVLLRVPTAQLDLGAPGATNPDFGYPIS